MKNNNVVKRGKAFPTEVILWKQYLSAGHFVNKTSTSSGAVKANDERLRIFYLIKNIVFGERNLPQHFSIFVLAEERRNVFLHNQLTANALIKYGRK